MMLTDASNGVQMFQKISNLHVDRVLWAYELIVTTDMPKFGLGIL